MLSVLNETFHRIRKIPQSGVGGDIESDATIHKASHYFAESVTIEIIGYRTQREILESRPLCQLSYERIITVAGIRMRPNI